MASVTKTNPIIPVSSRSFTGKTIDAYTVDIANHAVDMDNEMNPGEVFELLIQVFGEFATIIGITENRSDGANNGQVIDFYVEGDFGTDTYDGSSSETFAAFLQTRVRDLGATAGANSVDLTSATVVRKADSGMPLVANV